MTWDRRLYFPSEGSRAENFFFRPRSFISLKLNGIFQSIYFTMGEIRQTKRRPSQKQQVKKDAKTVLLSVELC